MCGKCGHSQARKILKNFYWWIWSIKFWTFEMFTCIEVCGIIRAICDELIFPALYYWPLVKTKRVYQKIIFLISQPKHMLWVLKRTVSPKTYVQTDRLENIYNFTL